MIATRCSNTSSALAVGGVFIIEISVFGILWSRAKAKKILADRNDMLIALFKARLFGTLTLAAKETCLVFVELRKLLVIESG